MFHSLRSRIAVAYGALMVACVGALTVYLVSVGQETYLATLQEGVQTQARLVSVAARPHLVAGGRLGEINALAKRLGQEAGVRVTIVDRAGVVLGDSDHDPATMENHGGRPEVADALAGGQAESRRLSATVGYDTLYVAVPIEDDGRVVGAARVALPLARVNQASQGVAVAIALGGLTATLLAVLLALFVARSIAGPLNELTVVADQMARGELDRRVRSRSRDEVGRLAAAFDEMADRLQGTVKAISAERNTLAAVLSTMVDGILIVDGDGRVTMANRAAAALLHTSQSLLEGRSYVEALRDHELVRVLQRCLAERTQESGSAEVGPGRRSLRIVAAPLVGERQAALVLLQDLTDVRRAETVRRDFIANVSHELRTPLTTLKALVETLEEGAISDPETSRDFLSKMHGEVDGLAHLVSELLELSRIESGQAAFRFEPIEPAELVREAVERLVTQSERSGIALEPGAGGELPAVAADRQRILQVLLNLIHNAIKFTRSGGRVEVGARREGDEVLFRVADTGVGIPAGDLPRIFERFYKGDRSRANSGTGLGLAIAKHVVQAHGGRIWAESVEGVGSTFFFTLPIAQGSGIRGLVRAKD